MPAHFSDVSPRTLLQKNTPRAPFRTQGQERESYLGIKTFAWRTLVPAIIHSISLDRTRTLPPGFCEGWGREPL